ncbi:MAG: helix-turn-helix transcriptional regulator [Polyangiaceae bacterium]
MKHVLVRPRPPLDMLVDSFWAADTYQALTPRERVLPTGGQALVVHLDERPLEIYADARSTAVARFDGAAVCGARSSPLVFGTAFGPTVGVHFKPGGARPFFDLPADELAEQTASLEQFWGTSTRLLREQLAECGCLRGRVQILESFLLERARRQCEPSAALSAALSAFEELDLSSVAEVSRRTGLSPKRLLCLFRDEVGLSPKTFWRIRRFRSALQGLERGASRGADLATHHGYFDQAHFLREFRALAGSSPREYLAARIVDRDHVALFG